MSQKLKNIRCIYPNTPDYAAVFASKAFIPFSANVMCFIESLSSKLLHTAEAKAYPDVITFAFWCRKASLLKMKAEYENGELRLGRGIVFHIAPSNVPVNFAYSLVAALLAGNANIVRVPTKEFAQVQIICAVICQLLNSGEFPSLVHHIALLRYEHDEDITAYFSQHSDVRVIWGGDSAIRNIRQTPLPPRSFDLTFSDRYSFCAINADEYLKETEPERVALCFYNDTYLFDQNACTAPHLVIWLGSVVNISAAKKIFWAELHKVVKEKYILQPVLAVGKYAAICAHAIKMDNPRIEVMPDNLIVRISISKLPENIEDYRSSAGYFLEFTADSLDKISRIITRKYQTFSYFGLQPAALQKFVLDNRPCGVDRIVSIGKTTDFSLVWDGYDLIRSLSRICSID